MLHALFITFCNFGGAELQFFIFLMLASKIFKGTVQRKLTGVLTGINRKLMICQCSDGYSFFNLKGLRSLKSKNVISALTGTLF
jgi:hypothetical protein